MAAMKTVPSRESQNTIDPLILPLVQCLNYLGLETTGSCQGHPKRGRDNVQDSRVSSAHSGRPISLSNSYVVIAARPYQIPVMASLAERLWTECALPTGADLLISQSGALACRATEQDQIRFDLILRYRSEIGEMPIEERQRVAIDAVVAVVKGMAAGR